MRKCNQHLTDSVFLVKCFLTAFLLTAGVSLFSQVSHNDSTGYFGLVELSGNVIRDMKGKPIEIFSIENKKNIITNETLRSKITFINFWFETCTPCVAEFQALEKFYNKNKYRENFQFISITFESDSTIQKVKKANNLTYPIYHLSSDSCRKIIGRSGYPATFIIDKNLNIVYALRGGSSDPKVADKDLNYFIQAELDKQLK